MSDSPKVRIGNDVKTAMKSGDKERLSTLRMLLSEVNNEEIRSGSEVDDAALPAIVRRSIKQRREAAEQFRKGGRPELAEKEEREIAVLEEYLPKQATEDEIRAVVGEIVAAKGLSGPAAIGVVMKEALARLGSSAEGAVVSRIARELLAGG
jgi:uncharacterized protein YqeY